MGGGAEHSIVGMADGLPARFRYSWTRCLQPRRLAQVFLVSGASSRRSSGRRCVQTETIKSLRAARNG